MKGRSAGGGAAEAMKMKHLKTGTERRRVLRLSGRAAALALFAIFLSPGASVAAQTAPAPLSHPPGGFVTVRGKKLWYESEGAGEPLILVAGGPGFSHAYFHPFLSALADTRRVIYFDAYGTGKSDRAESSGAYSLAGAVEDLEGLRRALGLGKVTVLGHSYGGFVAQLHAVKYPGSVSRLILANTFPSGDSMQSLQDSFNRQVRDQLPEVWEKVARLRARGLRSSSKEHQEAYSVAPTFSFFYNPENARHLPQEPDLYNPELWYAMGGDDADFVVRGEISRFDVRAHLKGLRMPVLVVAGRFDRMVPPGLTVRYKRLAPRATFVMFERSGHFPFIEEPERFLAAVRGFTPG
jgi:proline iminopeptidase